METNATLSAVAGVADGTLKAETDMPQDVPYLIQNPIFQFWSDAASFLWQQRKLSSENNMQQNANNQNDNNK